MNKIRLIHDSIINDGFIVSNFCSYTNFSESVSSLGLTVEITDIRFRPESNAYLASNRWMALHTDHPSIDIVCWYCEQNSDQGGESIFLDFNEVIEQLAFDEVETLRNICVSVPATNFDHQRVEYLLSDRGVYFADWLIDKEVKLKNINLLNKVIDVINSCTPNSVLLERGQALFLNNKRYLHGRRGFVDGKSSRHLIRHWVKREDQD